MFPDIPSISGVIPAIFNPAEFSPRFPFIFGNSCGLSGRVVFRAKFNLPVPFLISMGYFNLNLSFNIFWIAGRFMSWEDKVKFRAGDLKSFKDPLMLYLVSKQLRFTFFQLAWS